MKIYTYLEQLDLENMLHLVQENEHTVAGLTLHFGLGFPAKNRIR